MTEKALVNYLQALEKKGFKVVSEAAKKHTIIISDGYIPHGHHSESWSYTIDANRVHILNKENQRYALIEGIYSFRDTSHSDEEGRFPCIALLELPNGKAPNDMSKDEIQKNVKDFRKIVNGKLERKKPWWSSQ